MTPPNPQFLPEVHPTVKTLFRLAGSAVLFFAVEWFVDCSGLDKFADYYEFLEQNQQTLIDQNTEKQMSKAIGKLFTHPQNLRIQVC